MPDRERLEAAVPWVRLTTTDADWRAADPALLAAMLSELHLIRAFEETVLELAGEGLVHGPAHSSVGQEGGAVGSIVGLRSSDGVNGSHRGHHQFLAKALTHVSRGSFDLGGVVTPVIDTVLQRTLAEILGLAQGYCNGRGGSMHLQWLEAGALGTNAIVGGGVPMGAGNSFAQRHAGTDDVTISYFGDGAVNIGSVLETMNLASAWTLPFAFFIENNLYAVSTTVAEATGEHRLSGRGPGFGIPSWQVDGMDPLAVHLAVTEATERMRGGEGPAVIEAEVYRFFHQNGPYPGSAFGYRAKTEEESWRARDPLERVATEMLRLGLLGEDEVRSVRAQAVEAMRDVAGRLTEADPEETGKRRIRPELWPDPAFVDVGLRSDGAELEGGRVLEPVGHDGPRETRRFVEFVAAVMDRRMAEDERIVVLGEDVHRLNGGTNGATKGLAKAYPGRVLGTPISENAFSGLAGGMALDGRFRPVVEFMYPDFLWVAADQVFNQIGKARHMFGGVNPVPLVLRTKVAMGSGYGSQHLMDPAGIFATSPGWRIIAPSTAADYIGLMNTALALDDPVLVIEHVDLYGLVEEAPEGDLDYRLPVGRAVIRRPGTELTVISYLSMVRHALEAVEQTGADAEVVDLRWLDRASIDWETIGESIRKTNAVLIVEQGAQGTSYGGWLADEIQRRYFDHLDSPVTRVTGGEASPSISKVLERAAIARTQEVAAGLESVLRATGEALMATIVRMPEVLANVTEAAIQNWLVRPGEHVAVGAPLAEVETEKAVVEYAAETEGTILKLLVSEGQPVAVGDPIALLGAPGETADEAPADGPDQVASAPEPETAPEGIASPVAEAPAELAGSTARGGSDARRFASPIVRRLARERGIDLAAVTGSGPGGRIVRVDLDRLGPSVAPAPDAEPEVPKVSEAQPDGRAVVVPLSPMRRAIARRLTESKSTVPHFYMSADCRVDELMRLRGTINAVPGQRVSVNDFVLKAVADALAEVSEANAVWAGDGIRRFSGVDLALAVALQDGLVTPVIVGADSMSLRALAAASADLAARAKAGRLRQHELEGGVSTVSNLGMYGVKEFAAIINPPQSTILAVGAASVRPIVDDGALAVGTVMTLTLSADHRVVDGAIAARLLSAVVERLEQPVRLLL